MGVNESRFAAQKPGKTRLWRNDEWILGTGGGLGNTPGGVCGSQVALHHRWVNISGLDDRRVLTKKIRSPN